MSRPAHLVIAAATAAVALALPSASPARADDAASISVSVQMAAAPAPCIQVAAPAAVDLPVQEFATVVALPDAAERVTSCGTEVQSLAIRATEPQSATGARWALATGSAAQTGTLCSASSPIDRAAMTGADADLPGGLVSTTFTTVEPAHAPGAAKVTSMQLRLPCEGSVGAGETMRFAIQYLATLA